MKRLAAFAFVLFLIAGASFAAAVTTYQVTGPVVEVTSDSITVMKGKDKWQIAHDASTKMPSNVKVGTKVTIMYRMTATSVEVLPAPKPAKKK